tara:strand:+ start:699 stop:1115 length:417 start_codon:yes stop_codon:yes gene_type:complete
MFKLNFFKYIKKYLIVKYEKINDKNIAIKFRFEKMGLSDIKILFKPYTLTAANIGIERKKDIFAESDLLNFRNREAVIAIPERLTPGIKERICKRPIKKADLTLKLSFNFFLFSFLSLRNKNIPKIIVVHPIIFKLLN